MSSVLIVASDICFQPLKESREFNAEELFAYYKQKPQCELKKFLPIIESSPVYPVILDANGKVLSLPPIINGELSKVSVETRNLFIECTANDLTKAKIVINTMCCMFSQYSRTPFTVEAVDVQYEVGRCYGRIFHLTSFRAIPLYPARARTSTRSLSRRRSTVSTAALASTSTPTKWQHSCIECNYGPPRLQTRRR